jgi:orotidine-5'-phosphate decarboxylase
LHVIDQEETKSVEKEILKAIQYGEGSGSDDEELEIALENGKQPPKIVSVAMLELDDEGDAREDGGEESELEEFEAIFQKPKKPKTKATPCGGKQVPPVSLHFGAEFFIFCPGIRPFEQYLIRS